MQKRFLVLMIVLVSATIGLTTPASAQTGTAPPPATEPEDPITSSDWWKDILRRYDTDGDGKLSNEEYLRFWQDMQDEDLGEDGYLDITWEEFYRFLHASNPGLTEQDIRNIFNEIDTDGNGVISPQEWKAFQKRVRPAVPTTPAPGTPGGPTTPGTPGTPGGN